MKTNLNKFSATGTLRYLLPVVMMVFMWASGQSQSVISLDRAHILTEPTHIQKKILDNTPGLYEITDLVNYPLAFEESRQRPGIEYLTVADFNASSLVRKMDMVVYNPNLYYIALDATVIPPLKIVKQDRESQTIINE